MSKENLQIPNLWSLPLFDFPLYFTTYSAHARACSVQLSSPSSADSSPKGTSPSAIASAAATHFPVLTQRALLGTTLRHRPPGVGELSPRSDFRNYSRTPPWQNSTLFEFSNIFERLLSLTAKGPHKLRGVARPSPMARSGVPRPGSATGLTGDSRPRVDYHSLPGLGPVPNSRGLLSFSAFAGPVSGASPRPSRGIIHRVC